MNNHPTDHLQVELTEREQDILIHLAEDLSNQEIADRLFLASSTVKHYVRQLNQKLYTKNRQEIVDRATELGLLKTKAQIDSYVRPRENLPRQTTPFIGRDAELDELHNLLAKSDVRLLTILATGGMGKTRLALEAAEQQLPNFKDGVYFIPLQPLTAVEQIIPTIAGHTFFPLDQNERSPKAQVLDFLAEKQMLLVMDNFEHLLDGAPLINELLQTAPDVKIIITTREKLNLMAETVYLLHGLQAPNWKTSEDALHYDAVRLLVEAAHRVKPDWSIANDNLKYVTRICRLTQGMPLGILLAMSWLDALSIDRICDEIAKNVTFLETEMRDVPERQRSIQAVFDYAWQKLSTAEQNTLMKLSIFRGGCGLEAAESIANASLRTLQVLVSKALLQRNQLGRYELHELLRQFVEAQLKEHRQVYEQVMRDYTTYYLNFMANHAQLLKGGQQRQTADKMTLDFDNVKQAWQYATQNRDITLLERAFEGMQLYSLMRLSLQEAQHLWQLALENCHPIEDEEPTRFWLLVDSLYNENPESLRDHLALAIKQQDHHLQFRILYRLASLCDYLHDYDSALTLIKRSLQAAEAYGDKHYIASCYLSLAFFHGMAGNLTENIELNQKLYAIYDELSDVRGMSNSLQNLSSANLHIIGDRDLALQQIIESLQMSLQSGHSRVIASALGANASLQLMHRNYDKAHKLAQEALEIGLELNHGDNIAGPKKVLAMVAYFDGDLATAWRLCEEAYQTTRNPSIIYVTKAYQSYIAATQDKPEIVINLLHEIRDFFYPLFSDTPLLYLFAPGLAYLATREEDFALAVKLCSLALQAVNPYRLFFEDLPLLKDLQVQLQTHLPGDVYKARWHEGQSADIRIEVERFMNIGES